MTRAKDQLDIIVPQRFYVHQQSGRGDRHVYATRTRFIPDSILHLFETRAWPAAASSVETKYLQPKADPRLDIGARMRARWGDPDSRYSNYAARSYRPAIPAAFCLNNCPARM
jgi:DNA helicase II / ATP-dependent DNA helicase PcrA